MKSLPVQHAADTKNSKSARGPFGDIVKRPYVLFIQRSVRQNFNGFATDGAQPFLGLGRGGERDSGVARRRADQRIPIAALQSEGADQFVELSAKAIRSPETPGRGFAASNRSPNERNG